MMCELIEEECCLKTICNLLLNDKDGEVMYHANVVVNISQKMQIPILGLNICMCHIKSCEEVIVLHIFVV